MTERLRLLLIEDDPRDVQTVRTMLSAFNGAAFEVETAGSIEQCETVLSRDDGFDVLLLDNTLPGEDGLSWLRRDAESPYTPPVIVVTGDGDERLAAESIKAGAYDYLPKSALSDEVLGHSIIRTREKHRLKEGLEGAEQVVFSLALAVEAKDPEIGDHLLRVRRLTTLVGRGMGLDEHDLTMLQYSCVLHDIGKIGVSDSILLKQEPLTPAEWEEIQKHPIIGERICATLRYSPEVGPIIRHHHESWDGTGYPDGLAGENIPVGARILSVVDSYDVMSSGRSFRPALSAEDALERISCGGGQQFDPEIAGRFCELMRKEIAQRPGAR